MNQFEIDQLRRQRSSYMKSIVGLEALVQLTPSQANTMARYRSEIARIEGILTDSGEPLDVDV